MAQLRRKNLSNFARAWWARTAALVSALPLKITARSIVRSAGLSAFALGGFIFVGVVALLISIIQFQLRIIEAKNQSRNFSLTSLTQSVMMQQEFVELVKTVQGAEDVAAKFFELQTNYYSVSANSVDLICGPLAKEVQQHCATAVAGALKSVNLSDDTFFKTIASITKGDIEEIKPKATEALAAARARINYMKDNETEISKAKSACTLINFYVSSAGESSFIQSFSPQYVTSAVYRCSNSWTSGRTRRRNIRSAKGSATTFGKSSK